MAPDVYTEDTENAAFPEVFIALSTDSSYAEAIALAARKDEGEEA